MNYDGRVVPLELAEEPAPKRAWDPEEFKIVARYRKARKLTRTLLDAGASTPEVVESTPMRRLAERLAEVNESSDVTWALVAEMLREAL